MASVSAVLLLLSAPLLSSPPESATAKVADASADDPLGRVVRTSKPELSEEPRPWVDSTGRYSVVATLVGIAGESALLRDPDGKIKPVPLNRLSSDDAVYARLRTAPRVDPSADVLLGTVVGIGDGDTVELRTINKKTKKVRLDSIDAPESGQPFGTRAKERLAEMVFQKDVRVEISELDRYGRYIGQIYVDGRWVNRAMIRTGMAWHYREYSRDPKLAQAELVARQESLGIWAAPDRVAPWDWRRGTRESDVADAVAGDPHSEPTSETSDEERTVYVTASGSKYHRAGCQYLAKSSRTIPYSQAERAYSPCSQCNP